jgi:hypothetical protein
MYVVMIISYHLSSSQIVSIAAFTMATIALTLEYAHSLAYGMVILTTLKESKRLVAEFSPGIDE